MRKLITVFLLMFAFIANAQLQVFTTIEKRLDLRNYSTITNNRVIAAIGLSSAWDVPTEIWTFDSSSMAVDNGTTVLKPNDILVTDPGRFLFRTYFVKQYGTLYSKEFNSALTVSGSTATFDISSAGFTSIGNIQATAILASGTVLTLPLTSISAQSLTSITVSLVESKTTNTLLISSAEGLENHAVAGTIVYLTVKGN